MAQYSTVLIMTHFKHITPTRPWHDAENTSMKDARWRSKARSAWTGITSRLTRIIAQMFVLHSILNRFTIRSFSNSIVNCKHETANVEKRKKEKKKNVAYFPNISICYQYIDSHQCSHVRINSISTKSNIVSNNIWMWFFSYFFLFWIFVSFYIFVDWTFQKINIFAVKLYDWLTYIYIYI